MKSAWMLGLGALAAGCASGPTTNSTAPPLGRFEPFSPERQSYRLGPGDELAVTLYSVPDLDRTVTVGPDGRIALPLVPPVMAANRTVGELQFELYGLYAAQLVDPRLDVSVATFSPQRVFVGGEVGQPGVYELPGQIDPLQAIITAGGFTDRSRDQQVLLLRRLEDGSVVSYSFDVRRGILDPRSVEFGPLQRFDVVYVPKSRIAEQNLFVQQFIRNALPIDFSLFYDVAGNQNN